MEKRDWTEEEIVELCESYLPLVYSLIKRWNLQGNREEYVQIGRIALFEAWRRFDPDKGHFGAFAKSYVYGRMKQEIFKEDRWRTRHVAAEPVALVEMSPAVDGDEEDVQAPADYGHRPIVLEGVDWCLLQLPPASGADTPARR